MTGPDFPTGGTIFRFEDQRNSITGEKERVDVIRHMYATGRGRVIIRGQVSFEEIRPGAWRWWSPSCRTRSTRPR